MFGDARWPGMLAVGAVAALAAAWPALASEAPAGPPVPDSCAIRFPDAQSIAAGLRTSPVHVRVGAAGVTDAPGPGPGVVAQLGLGPAGSDPRTSPGWEYVDAAYSLQAGDEDEYEASLTAPAVPGDYAYAYRVSLDGGGS